jgi:putative transposase
MNYRRRRIPGGSFFFTVTTQDRQPLLVDHYDRLLRSLTQVQSRFPFELDAWVVLPDHLHTLWTLPPGDTDYSLRWMRLKSLFSRGLEGGLVNASKARKRERGIWQRRFWEHAIRDEADWMAHLDFIHYDPVKHGFASRPGDWAFSTFLTWMDLGHYPADWGRQAPAYDFPVGME